MSNILKTLTSATGPILYNAKVAGQIAKQVYVREGMSPPSGAQFEKAGDAVLKFAQTAKKHPTRTWNSISTDLYLKAGLVAAEAYAFFLVGEIVGRRNFVGYSVQRAEDGHHEESH